MRFPGETIPQPQNAYRASGLHLDRAPRVVATPPGLTNHSAASDEHYDKAPRFDPLNASQPSPVTHSSALALSAVLLASCGPHQSPATVRDIKAVWGIAAGTQQQ